MSYVKRLLLGPIECGKCHRSVAWYRVDGFLRLRDSENRKIHRCASGRRPRGEKE